MRTRALLVLLCALSCCQTLSAQADTLMVDGEIVALDSAAISPPAIAGMWNFTITRLVAEGTMVKAGDAVLGFDGAQQVTRLNEKMSALNEKRTQRERLRLELDERQRNESVLAAERAANLEKARRKADQPVEAVPGIEYRKLIIEREQAERQHALAQQRLTLAAEQRRQEWLLVEAELSQLEAEVEMLRSGMEALNVRAPRDGVVLHLGNWQGEKFDVGTQVWLGQAVAQIPDLSRLAARVQLPEREFLRVAVGQRAQVRVEGVAGAPLNGRIVDIGKAVRSKSRVNPVPVIDALLELDTSDQNTRLRPGQSVRVDIYTKSDASAESQP